MNYLKKKTKIKKNTERPAQAKWAIYLDSKNGWFIFITLNCINKRNKGIALGTDLVRCCGLIK